MRMESHWPCYCHKQATFNSLAKQGVLLDQYYALTHPSEPNYVATVGGDFWGMGDDNFYNIPSKCGHRCLMIYEPFI